MEKLNKSLLQSGSLAQGIERGTPPTQVKILQFGEGNFLRAFIDFFVDELNEKANWNGGIVAVQPIAQGLTDMINDQAGLYTVYLRGLENNQKTTRKRLITSLTECINPYATFDAYLAQAHNPALSVVISNTTEAGITYVANDTLAMTPPMGFPAKITQLLHARFTHFKGDKDKGLVFIPCELIDNSGDKLKEIVLQHAKDWQLSAEFTDWINEANYFANTLVDRIVTGYPKDEITAIHEELGYKDDLVVTAEIFHFLVLEGKAHELDILKARFPLHQVSDSIIWTTDATPYKHRKVRILNGGHTMSVLAAYLHGKDTVGEMMDDPLFQDFLKKGIYEEVIPTLDLDKKDLEDFAASIFDRFANPFIKHYLLSISLNSVAKFKARVLPTLLTYVDRKGALPSVITFSLAALIAFYKGGSRQVDGTAYEVSDDPEIVGFFAKGWAAGDIPKLVENTLANESFWGQDLNQVKGLTEAITNHLQIIETQGILKEGL